MVKYFYDKYNADLSYGFGSASLIGQISKSDGGVLIVDAVRAILSSPSHNHFNLYENASVNTRTGIVTYGGNSISSSNGIISLKSKILYYTYDSKHYYLRMDTDEGSGSHTVYLHERPITTTYSIGSLVQSDLQAENGTYPTNGRHTDGYWYVRKTVVNTAPTTPGAFTQPTGVLEIGDSKVISWGASSDAESNLSKYILEVSINGGAFSALATPTTNSYTYTIPTATSIKFRVKAVDSAGLESSYRESSIFTVQQPQYYYEKYNVISTPIYTDKVVFTTPVENNNNGMSGFIGYTVDSSGKFVETGSYTTIDRYAYPGTVYYVIGNVLYKYTVASIGAPLMQSTATVQKELVRTDYSRGSLVQSGIIGGLSTYPTNGRHSDGYWYVRGSRVNQSITPTGPFTAPTTGVKLQPGETISISFGASTAPNLSLYEVDYRYNGTGSWTPLTYGNSLTRSLMITTDKTLKTLELRVRAKNTSNIYSDYVYSEVFEIEHNAMPLLTLNTIDNQTLYENDTILLDGQASDVNNGDIVNVKYSIDGGTARAITTAISNGTTPVPFSKQLQFIKGILYDGETALTDVLSEGNAHNIKVWAEDDKGGKSAEKVISFHIVANRAPLIMVDPFIAVSDLINNDSITVTGETSDPEGQNVKIRYNLNSGAFTEFFNAAAGPFSLNISLDKLRDGLNTLQLQVEDSYGFITSKTLNVNKTFNSTPILKSVARYKNILPVGGIVGMVSWIESMDGDLDVNMSASMVMSGEQESFEEMSLTNSAPTDLNIEEKEFVIQKDTKKDDVSIKISISRTEANSDKAVKRITGALQT